MSAAAELRDLLGADRVLTDEEELEARAGDMAPRTLLARRAGIPVAHPQCVVRPASAQEVARLLAWASKTRTPVVPFGGGSSVLDSVSADGVVVVDLRGLDRVLDIDEVSRIVTVQAGVMGPALDAALRERGYLLGHEPQSIELSTVGGWIATRASGQLSARYGGIEDLLVALEAVLPDGRIVRSKVVPRRAAGPDVAALMIGSEGALGIVTEATLRIAPLPEERFDRCVRFAHMADAVAACRRLAQSELRPTVVRLYDTEDAAIFLRHHPDEPQGPLLLVSFDGHDAEERADAALHLLGGEGGNDALVDYWWDHRNDAAREYLTLMAGEGMAGPHGVVDTIEVAGSWSSLRALYHSMKEALSAEANLVGCHLSHIYPDGACLYFTLASFCESDEQAASVNARWWEVAMRACLGSGGTISHHHGIGRVKAPWLPEELGGWYEVLRAVKSAVDPHRIMNPGVLGL